MPNEEWNMSAPKYSLEVENISFYRATNAELVTAVRIEPGITIVDLACGSGAMDSEKKRQGCGVHIPRKGCSGSVVQRCRIRDSDERGVQGYD